MGVRRVFPRDGSGRRRLGTAAVLIVVTLGAASCGKPAPPARRAPAPTGERNPGPAQTVEDEVRENVLNLAVGDHRIADFGLPEAFLRRVADRVIRESYRERYHRVYRDVPDAAVPESRDGEGGRAAPGAIRIVARETDDDRLAARLRMQETRPAVRGFRASLLDRSDVQWPAAVSPVDLTAAQRRAADLVATRLGRDGLLPTLVRALDRLGRDASTGTDAERLDELRLIGLPVDLLPYFEIGGDEAERTPQRVLAAVRRRLAGGADPESVAAAVATTAFRFAPSRADFRVATESGEEAIELLRTQVTRGTYWKGIGAGGSVDVARQLVERLPDVSFLISVEERFLEAFLAIAGSWPLIHPEQLAIVPEPMAVAQWAADNGKAGSVPGAGGPRAATLVPRFASRREEGSVFVPGETFLAEGLAAAGMTVVTSPLLFQGGNVMAVRDPATRQRIALVGEAEVFRNTALGLTEAQALDAIRLELGVDRCEVLPAVSFHLDFDLTVRAHGGRLIAFVNDEAAAVRIILAAGVSALERHGVLDAGAVRTARARLASGEYVAFLDLVAPAVVGRADPTGRYPLSLAQAFAIDAIDSPVGNFQRFMVALDLLAAEALPDERLPADRHARAYLRSMRRAMAARAAVHEHIASLGWEVVAVPGLAAGDRSLSPVNGLQDLHRYVMPVYGGLYAPLDEAARAVFARRLGPEVEIVPISCGESQRRYGAVHCSVAAFHCLP